MSVIFAFMTAILSLSLYVHTHKYVSFFDILE